LKTIFVNRHGREVILEQQDYSNHEKDILNAFGQPLFDHGDGWMSVGTSRETEDMYFPLDPFYSKEDAVKDLTEIYNRGNK
jgi:hypothetical protein